MSGERCCPGAGSMAHVRGCVNHPEPTPTPVPSEVAETTAGEREVEALAEVLSWTGGEFMRWYDDAHPDHNRWSWRGDGHGSVMRDEFRDQARAILASDWLAALLDRVRREEGAKVLREAAEEAAIDAALIGVDYVIQRLRDRAASVGRGEGL